MAASTMHPVREIAAAPVEQSEGAVGLVDELVARDSGGMVAIDGALAELAALAHHVERRADLAGKRALVLDGRVHDEPWREAAAVLEVAPSRGASAVAAALAETLAGGVLVVHEMLATQWGRAVSDELARRAADERLQGAVVLLSMRRPELVPHASIAGGPRPSDLLRYFEALVQSGRQRLSAFDRFETLERWWFGAASFDPRTAQVAQRARAALLSREARSLHARIVLARRSCDEALVEALGSRAARDELVDARWLRLEGDRVMPAEPSPRIEAQDAARVAEALSTSPDAWARMRAAELWALSGDSVLAHARAREALQSAPDAAARSDFWRRLEPLLDRKDAAQLTGYAELALGFGDADEALALSRQASAAGDGAHAFSVAMALGRATRARGDVHAAGAALEQALALAAPDERCQAEVELAELALTRGERDRARALALAACAAPLQETRLGARNIAGKILLAEARWDEAERHFAADEHEALRAGRLSDALRARLNRAIANLSRGSRTEARALLESVLADGEESGDRRAVAFSLANLSTLATLAHDYGAALSLLERAIDEVRALGDSLRLCRLILNLAELRLRVGLVREAEQALVFARQASGSAVGGSLSTLLSFTHARARLAGGQTVQAVADVQDAIATAERSSDGAKLGECHRLAARIALEDGDVARARRHIAAARRAGAGPDSEAELALLEAAVARAAGQPFAALALTALDRAREAEDSELVRQAQVLCCLGARDEGDEALAQRHLEAALRLRDSVAASLPDSLRDSYLARRELAEMARLEAGRREIVRCEPVSRTIAAAGRNMVGTSRAMRTLRTAISKVGPSEATVLIAGESGTGKELVADSIHAMSRRGRGPLVKVNCAALVETLLLSELFGHEKGAFTGAVGRKRGHFEQAHGGTIFLDEIGDISPKTQVALLRVLQEHTFERVGGHATVEVDVRVICATHRDLRKMVEEGSFREDLYYRLCGVTLQVPSLRERLEDLPELAAALLRRIAAEQGHAAKRLGPDAVAGLSRHGWPGNVRELENALRAASLFAESETLSLRDFTDNVEGLRHLGEAPSIPPPSHTRLSSSPSETVYAQVKGGTSLPDMKRALERACIERALEEADGNITKAAMLLGMKRPRLSQLVNQYARESTMEVAK